MLRRLVDLSGNVKWGELDDLHSAESKIINDNKGYYYLCLNKQARKLKGLKRYLAITSLPFGSVKKGNEILRNVWPVGCDTCDDFADPLMGFGNVKPHYMFIGSAHSLEEDIKDGGRAWSSGEYSEFLRMALVKAGIYHKCWLTNVVKCRVDNVSKIGGRMFNNCDLWLEAEIQTLKPKVVVTMGSIAKYQLSMSLSQEIIDDLDAKICTISHPSYYVSKRLPVEQYEEEIREKVI